MHSTHYTTDEEILKGHCDQAKTMAEAKICFSF